MCSPFGSSFDFSLRVEPFSPFVPMPDLDFLFDGFMTEDCAHMYFSGIGYIFSTEPI